MPQPTEAIIYAANSGSNDISIISLDRAGGQVRNIGRAAACGPVMPLIVSHDRRLLHAAIKGESFSIETFAIDRPGGGLRPAGRIAIPASMNFLDLDKTGRYLLGAAYHGHIACVWAIGPDGLPLEKPLAVLEPGKHPHAVLVDATNRFAYIPVLGDDKLAQYRFHADGGKLEPNTPPSVSTPKGAGPRHFRFSPDGRFVYLLSELDGHVFTYAANRENGTLSEQSSVSIIPPDRPEDKAAKMWAADIHVSPDGKFVYTSERTTSNLVCFAADPASGRLRYASHVVTERQPRSFLIDSSGNFLVAAGEKSDNAVCYARDGLTGTLTPVSRCPTGTTPNWVVELILSHDGG